MRKIKLLSLFMTILLCVSCQNTLQKCYAFVNAYNNSASQFQNQYIYSTNARLEEDKVPKEHIITIDLDYNLKKKEIEENFGMASLPKILSLKMIEDAQVLDLIEDDVSIVLRFRSLDNFIVEKVILDKKNIEKLTTEKNNLGLSNNTTNNVNQELNEVITILNKNLPIDLEEGMSKLLKIEIDKDNNFVYVVEITEAYKDLLKSDEAKAFMKEKLQNDERTKKLIALKTEFNLNQVLYRFQEKNGKKVYDFSIN